MKKSIEILKKLKPTEKNYKKKVKLLAELILEDPYGGILLPDELIKWAIKVGLKVEGSCEDGTSWNNVWEK